VQTGRYDSPEGAKVFGGFRDNIGTQFHDNAASGLSSNGDIEIALWVRPGR